MSADAVRSEYLKQLSSEQLDDLLKYYTYSDFDTDDGYISLILNEIKQRECWTPHIPASEALEDFYANYANDEFLLEYYDEAFSGSSIELGKTKKADISQPVEKAVYRRKARPILRTALIAASVAAIILGSMVVAQAAGLDVFGAIARWTSDLFTFASSEDEPPVASKALNTEMNDMDTSNTLEEALLAYGIEIPLIPTWMPDGFKQLEFEITELTDKTTIYTTYKKEDSYLTIKIKLSDFSKTVYEKDENIEVQYINNIAYYIYSNIETYNAVCYFEGIEYRIGGNITKDELIKMLESINEG